MARDCIAVKCPDCQRAFIKCACLSSEECEEREVVSVDVTEAVEEIVSDIENTPRDDPAHAQPEIECLPPSSQGSTDLGEQLYGDCQDLCTPMVVAKESETAGSERAETEEGAGSSMNTLQIKKTPEKEKRQRESDEEKEGLGSKRPSEVKQPRLGVKSPKLNIKKVLEAQGERRKSKEQETKTVGVGGKKYVRGRP